MTPHKFNVGARVQYKPPLAHQATGGGEFVVERHLPPDGEGNQYRIESRSDGHRRVVHEINLVRAGSVF
jgi:hypothetical protein